MEVHHHSEIGHRHKKKFKEYIQEGLMIFLAVFMGFIAENIREHLSDRTKEKEYVSSLVTDLQQDSAKINEIMQRDAQLIKGQDSLINLLADSTSQANFSDRAYHLFFKYATSSVEFESTNRTISQLISSGNLRLIENARVADSISNYYDFTKSITTQTQLDRQGVDNCVEYAQNLFKFQYGLKPQTTNKKLISYNPDTITKYINKLTIMRISEEYYAKVDLKTLNIHCKNLIHFLKEEYHLH